MRAWPVQFPLFLQRVKLFLVHDVSLVVLAFLLLFQRRGVPLPVPYHAVGVEPFLPLFRPRGVPLSVLYRAVGVEKPVPYHAVSVEKAEPLSDLGLR